MKGIVIAAVVLAALVAVAYLWRKPPLPTIFITVTKTGAFVEGEPTSDPRAIRRALLRLRAGPGTRASVYVEEGADKAQVEGVFQELKRAGVNRLSIAWDDVSKRSATGGRS